MSIRRLLLCGILCLSGCAKRQPADALKIALDGWVFGDTIKMLLEKEDIDLMELPVNERPGKLVRYSINNSRPGNLDTKGRKTPTTEFSVELVLIGRSRQEVKETRNYVVFASEKQGRWVIMGSPAVW